MILCRDRAGEVHVFLNSCRHRGMKVCRYDEGNTPVFTCPYHGWSYGTDGKLVGVPYFREAYHSTARQVAMGPGRGRRSCASTRARSGPAGTRRRRPFSNISAISSRYLDLTLDGWDGSEGGTEVLGGIQKWLIPCNWKFPAENFCGDSYHNISHRSVDLVGIGPSGSGRRDMQERLMARRLHVAFHDRGHQTGVYVLPKDQPTPPAYQHSSVVVGIFRALRRRAARDAAANGARLIGSPGEIFPNTALHPRQPRTIAVWHPRGAAPDRGLALVPGRHARRRPRSRISCATITSAIPGPAGMTEQDDMENWNYAHAASRGTIARRYPYSYEQGLGFEIENYEWQGLRIPGTVIDITEAKSSEHNLRNLYRRWAEFMEAESWDELATWRVARAAE